MKLKSYLLASFLLISFIGFAQNKGTIVSALEDIKSGEGVIQVNAEPGINELLGTPNKRASLADDNATVTKMNGFRVLAYMGSNQKTAKGEAANRQSLINESFIEVDTYLDYDAPNWKLLVGDFVTRDEANIFMQLLQKQFPQFGKEIYIVNSTINVPVER